MRIALVACVFVSFVSATAAQTRSAQTAPPEQAVETKDGGTSVAAIGKTGAHTEILQSIFIPPILNAPFSAIVHTEWTRALPDGGSYTLVNERPIARDSQGRVYQQRWTLVPPSGRIPSQMTTNQIADPNAHTLYNCFSVYTPHKCSLESYSGSAAATYRPATAKTGPLPNNQGSSVHEELGKQTIEGVETTGTRDTITYNEGYFGNDRPATGQREFWFAASLGVNLRSTVVEPGFGKQVFTLTDVMVGEPDPRLFDPPEGYAIVDTRKPQTDRPE